MVDKELSFNFPDVSAKFWKQKIQADLRGADYNETLVWESPDGIHVKPFYHSEDLEEHPPLPSVCPNPWAVGQYVEVLEAGLANTLAQDSLERGAEHLHFDCKDGNPDLSVLLQNIDLATTQVSFHNWKPDYETLQNLEKTLPAELSGVYLNLDPLGRLAGKGKWKENREKDLQELTEVLNLFRAQDSVSVIGISMDLYHEAGGTRVQQLAYALAHMNEYLEQLGDAIGNKAITVNTAIGNDYFFEIAKLRALRILCSSLFKNRDLEMGIRIHARPGRRNKTLFDYNVNLLRSSTECMSAILGNADVVVNTRYDELYHDPNEFADRIARNQLLILKYESHFDKVGNPASGSYYLESLGDQLAQQSLELFKKLEEGGGYLKQLKEHNIQRKLKEAASREQAAFDEGNLILVGTNKFPNPEDRMKEDLEREPFPSRAARKTTIEPIIPKRLAAKHEKKRLNDE